MHTIVTLIVFAVAWTAGYYLFIRRWLMDYAITAGLVTRIEAAEGSLAKKLWLWLEAKKALLVAFLISGFSAAKSTAVSTVSTVGHLQASDLDPLKDQGLWHGLLNNSGLELKIISALAFVTALLAVKGHLTAAKIAPAAPRTQG